MLDDAYALRAAFLVDPQCTSSCTRSMAPSCPCPLSARCANILCISLPFTCCVRVCACVFVLYTHTHICMYICIVPHLYLHVLSRFPTCFIGFFFSDLPRSCKCVCVCLRVCVYVSVYVCEIVFVYG